ncbi:MAG: DsrE family protein [Anaerolineae bacterium]
MKLHVVLLSNDPERVYPALMFTLTAAAMGDEASLYCAMSGLDLVHPERRKAIGMEGMPPADKFFKDALAQGVKVYACGPSREMLEEMGITEDILDEGVKIEDVTGFLLGIKPVTEDTVLTFI